MNIFDLFSLQGTLFGIMLVGAILKKKGMIDENGKRCLTDICVNAIIPCNIFKSCLIEFNMGIFKSCATLLLAAFLIQFLCLFLNRHVFNGFNIQQKKVLQYCTIVPMSGFLGNPIAEGLYDSIGILYTSIFLLPMRIVMWSVGTTYFVADATVDRKKVIKNVLTHPCLVAVYLGLFFMVTQLQLPKVVTETVRYIGNCNTGISMFVVGTILADVKLTSIFNRDTLFFSVFRLFVLPAAALGIGLALNLNPVATGISVVMTGMPAGATAALFAARYNSDAPFATRCVIMTTLVSMITLPCWSYVVTNFI